VPVIYKKNVAIVITAAGTSRLNLNEFCSSLNCYLQICILIDTFVHLSAQAAELDGENRAGETALQQYANNRLQQLRESIKKLTIHLY
jgi:hypothetical protein